MKPLIRLQKADFIFRKKVVQGQYVFLCFLGVSFVLGGGLLSLFSFCLPFGIIYIPRVYFGAHFPSASNLTLYFT